MKLIPTARAVSYRSPKKQPVYTGTITDEEVEQLQNALIALFPETHLEQGAPVIWYMYHNHQLIDDIAALLKDSANHDTAAQMVSKKVVMALYILPIRIEANSAKDAEEKLLDFMRIATVPRPKKG